MDGAALVVDGAALVFYYLMDWDWQTSAAKGEMAQGQGQGHGSGQGQGQEQEQGQEPLHTPAPAQAGEGRGQEQQEEHTFQDIQQLLWSYLLNNPDTNLEVPLAGGGPIYYQLQRRGRGTTTRLN